MNTTEPCAYLPHLLAAYSAVWLVLCGYLAVLWKRERRLRAELDELQESRSASVDVRKPG